MSTSDRIADLLAEPDTEQRWDELAAFMKIALAETTRVALSALDDETKRREIAADLALRPFAWKRFAVEPFPSGGRRAAAARHGRAPAAGWSCQSSNRSSPTQHRRPVGYDARHGR